MADNGSPAASASARKASASTDQKRPMAQNIYDNPEFFAGYSRLPRQVDGLGSAPEWPVIRALLPALKGKRVVDLGCGFGWASRWIREQGAASVLGLDLSQNMIDRAKADTDDPAIEYRIADLDRLELSEGGFDLAFSSLTFHYVRDFDRLVRVLGRSLSRGGELVFSIEHPVFMAARHPRWILDEDGRKTWPVDSYSFEGERRTDWFTKGVLKYHRTLGTTLNILIDAGFRIRKVDEFAPTPAQIDRMPELAVERERPMFLIVSASI